MQRRIPLRPARRLGGALVTLALFATLAAPAHAAPSGEGSLFASAWRFLSALWEEAGFVVDPSGRPVPASPAADTGLVFDPGGRDQPRALFGEEGFVVDPGGLSVPTHPVSNTGLVFDPNG